MGLTESMAGSDSKGTRTTAVREGDEICDQRLQAFITNRYYADTYVITAQMDMSKGTRGIAAFIIEKGMLGFTFGKKEKKMGIRSSSTYELVFETFVSPQKIFWGKRDRDSRSP